MPQRPKSRPGTPTTYNEDRKRKMVTVTLSDKARAALERRAARHERGKSGVIEDLLVPKKKDEKPDPDA